jgi:hypothetical protein
MIGVLDDQRVFIKECGLRLSEGHPVLPLVGRVLPIVPVERSSRINYIVATRCPVRKARSAWVRRTPRISCEAPLCSGFVSSISLLDGLVFGPPRFAKCRKQHPATGNPGMPRRVARVDPSSHAKRCPPSCTRLDIEAGHEHRRSAKAANGASLLVGMNDDVAYANGNL